jgi:glycosyltransferase involved in cell wall biosynthesis
MTKATPHLSVAMITYNHERFVGEAVESILEQTYRDFELIIVDDGSTDATGEVIRTFRDPRLLYVRQDNQGPSEARNTALAIARGTLIAQMSGDDVAVHTRLERQIAAHNARPNSVVFSHCTFIDDTGRAIESPRWDPRINRPNWTRQATLRHMFRQGNCFLAPSAVAARSAFETVGAYNPVMLQLQDYDMWVRFLLARYEPLIVEEPLMRYRIRGDRGNLSSQRHEARVRGDFERRLLLRSFLTIDSARELAAIFPEAAALGYPLDDALVPFLLAMIGLQVEPRNDALHVFAADLLMEMMQDGANRKTLWEVARFALPDLFHIVGNLDPFDAERWRRRATGLERQLNDLVESRTWRLARALRDLASGMRALIDRR